MKKNFLPNLKLLGFLTIISFPLLISEKVHAQEYTTEIKEVSVFDSTAKFSNEIQKIRVAELTFRSEMKMASPDSVKTDEIAPPREWKKLGFVTEDLESTFPKVVHTSEDGSKSISYNALIAVMFKIIQEQDAKIEELELLVTKMLSKN